MRKMNSIAVVSALLALNVAVMAQPYQVNTSGATLFGDFFKANSSTNDAMDVDGDGIKGFQIVGGYPQLDQLAVQNDLVNTHWIMQHRGVGSGTGLADMVAYYMGVPDPSKLKDVSEDSYINHTKFTTGKYAVAPNRIDIAVMDVPTKWFAYVGEPGQGFWSRKPTETGYGLNIFKAWDSGLSNNLKTIGSLNTNTSDPDQYTIFDTQIAYVPITFIANRGTGLENITKAELQHLYVTGRLPSGENLAAATRDSGSGTRNGSMNSIGVDPSWGRGDNVGAKQSDSNAAILGNRYDAANLGGSSVMENIVQNRRLAVGYTGLMGASRSALDAAAGKYEILNVDMGYGPVRPGIENILHNNPTAGGYAVGGIETFATVGDPAVRTNLHNPHAADFIQNILYSIDHFESLVISGENATEENYMPGQMLARDFTLMSAIDYLPAENNPSNLVANASVVGSLQAYILNNTTLNVPAFGSINTAGLTPKRVQGSYKDLAGDVYAAGVVLEVRNRIAGDFNGDFARNVDDIAKMVKALQDPNGFAAAESDKTLIPDVIGDFDGNGVFDIDDVRYFADGLAMDGGSLNRAKGFMMVDTAATGGNLFGATLAVGAYKAGDSMADVAGNATTPGDAPEGADGIVDAADISYVQMIARKGLMYTALGTVPPVDGSMIAALDWSDLDDAVYMDLSCDMNADLIVDIRDVKVIVEDILGTCLGDVNLDGMMNQADLDIIMANIDYTAYGKGFADGDIDGDGYVTHSDLYVAINKINVADLNNDGVVDLSDLAIMAANWLVD